MLRGSTKQLDAHAPNSEAGPGLASRVASRMQWRKGLLKRLSPNP